MAKLNTTKGVIGILTGGGDVPGLNPAIRAVTIRALGCDMFVTRLAGKKGNQPEAATRNAVFIRILEPRSRLGCEGSAVQICPSRPSDIGPQFR